MLTLALTLLLAPLALAQDDEVDEDSWEVPEDGELPPVDEADEDSWDDPEDEGLPDDLPGGEEGEEDAEEQEQLDSTIGEFKDEEAEANERAPYQGSLHLEIGAHLGAHVPVSTNLAPGVFPQLEVGAELPWIGGRLHPVASLGWTGNSFTGSGEDERLDERYAWTVRQDRGLLGAGLTVHGLPGDARVNPEVTLLGRLELARTLTSATSAGADLGSSSEVTVVPGWAALGGVAVPMGRGDLVLRGGVSSSRLTSVLAGDSSTMGVAASLGFRYCPGRTNPRGPR